MLNELASETPHTKQGVLRPVPVPFPDPDPVPVPIAVAVQFPILNQIRSGYSTHLMGALKNSRACGMSPTTLNE